jgi:hypothetical protein
MLEPSAQIYALWEQDNAYTDSLGTAQALRNFDTSRSSGGAKASYRFIVGSVSLTPYLGLYGDYYFSKDSATTGGLTTVPILQGWAARTTAGVITTFSNGAQLAVGGLPTNSLLNFAGPNQFTGGVLQTNGVLDRWVGTFDPTNQGVASRVEWTGSGGFAAINGPLTVSQCGFHHPVRHAGRLHEFVEFRREPKR